MKRLLIIVGTRPNYIKVTQFKKVAERLYKGQFDIKILHTGQHFDASMADVFFKQLDIMPDLYLNISPGSANSQMASIMERLEPILLDFKPDAVIVPGDVNSTLAAALTAHKMNIPLVHLESGLRSFDRGMPEENNRILVDEISDLYFVTEQSGIDNLLKEGKDQAKMHLVGNTMIDTLVAFNEDINKDDVLQRYGLEHTPFVLMTIHRPATVDHKEGLLKLLKLMAAITAKHKLVFPMHPRTLKSFENFGLKEQLDTFKELVITKPLSYFSFQRLIKECMVVITDSGGIQEETTYRLKPCLTLRPNTERPSTITIGTNTLLPYNEEQILAHVESIQNNHYKKGQIPVFWDGKATERILEVIQNF